MFFTVEERKQINKNAKHIPKLYVVEMIRIVENVLNKAPVVIERKYYEPITAEDYD